jgi:hypothetical protein
MEIPLLEDYRSTPSKAFWDKFPHSPLPSGISTRVNIKVLKQKVSSMAGKWTRHQFSRANRSIQDLEEGASACQSGPLPPMVVPNAESAYEHGAIITDNIATWVKEGILAGPFPSPPSVRLQGQQHHGSGPEEQSKTGTGHVQAGGQVIQFQH